MAKQKVITPPTSNGVSVPAFEQKNTLHTLQAQKAMDRVFSRAAASLYRIDVILRIIGSEEDAAKVEFVISAMCKEVAAVLDEARQENIDMLEENGIDGMPVYDDPLEVTIRITSPHVGRFFTLVKKLDETVRQIDALWLSELMENKDRNEKVYRLQQKVIGLGSRIIGLERRAREAAKNQGKEAEVEKQAPSEDISASVDDERNEAHESLVDNHENATPPA